MYLKNKCYIIKEKICKGGVNIFINTIALLKNINEAKFSFHTESLISVLEGDALDIESFFEISYKIEKIIVEVPPEKYNLAINLVENLSNDLLRLEQMNSLNNEFVIGFPHLTIAFINLNLSAYLESIGLYEKAFNTLSRAKDPCVTPYDFITREGQTTLNNVFAMDHFLIDVSQLNPEKIRNFFLKRAYTHFTLSSVIGNINNEAELSYKQYSSLARETNLTLFDIKFYTSYRELCYANNILFSPDLERITIILKDWYPHEKNNNNRFLIASSIAKISKEYHWIDEALQVDNTYYWEERYELLLINELQKEVFDTQTALNIIWEFLNVARNHYDDSIIFELCKQKNSKLFTMILNEGLLAKDYDFLLALSYNWNAYNHENINYQSIDKKNIFLLIPNLQSGALIIIIRYYETTIMISSQSNIELNEILNLKNIIEDSWHVLTGREIIQNLEDIATTKLQVEASEEYLKKIREFINMDKLLEIFKTIPKDITFEYIESTWLNIPIISLLSAELQNSFFIASGYDPLPLEKPIQKALIWLNNEGMSYAEYELEALIFQFSKHEIKFDICQGNNLSKNIFFEKYCDTSYDLIWIATHGQFDFNDPPNSHIYVSPTEVVSARELKLLQIARDTRRQIILNACYSGCSAVNHNGMNSIGLSRSLVSPFQEIMGHLWFVRDLASATLGVFTLDYLLQNHELDKSVQLACKILQTNSNDAIADKIQSIHSELGIIERIRNAQSINLKLPFYSMSSIVYK